jgi:hypothetical protein
MKVWDVETISTALELARPWRVHVPVVLAALCGLRRGEIAALRWRHVDLDRAQLSVTESAEQTKAWVRYKSPKNGKGRTVALPAVVMAELRAHRLRQAQELLQLGVRLSDETFICAREDGGAQQPNFDRPCVGSVSGIDRLAADPLSRSATFAHERAPQEQHTSEDRQRAARPQPRRVDTGYVQPRHWIRTATSFRGCRKGPRRQLTLRSARR